MQEFVLWFTGMPSSGKTTLAKGVVQALQILGLTAIHLDGNDLREHPRYKNERPLGFSKEDRDTQNRRAITVASEHQREGKIVVASFISPREEHRIWIKRQLKNVVVIFVDTPLSICEDRDKEKGNYEKARKVISEGREAHFTGLDDVYEIPRSPGLALLNGTLAVDEAVEQTIKFLQKTYPEFFENGVVA